MNKLKLVRSKSPIYPGVDTFIVKLNYKLPIEKEISLGGKKLFLKDEFHITILGNENGKILSKYLKEKIKLSKKQIKDFYLEIENEIKETIKSEMINFKEEYYFLKKDYNRNNVSETRYSLIQIIHTDLLDKFYNMLKNKNIKTKFDSPIPHITLYKQKENAGIGLNKKEDLKKYSVKRFKRIPMK